MNFPPGQSIGIGTRLVRLRSYSSRRHPNSLTRQHLSIEWLEHRCLLAGGEIEVRGNSILIPDGDVTPNSLDHTNYGTVAVQGGSQNRTYTIRNTGAGPLLLTGEPTVQIEGSNAADFAVITQPAAEIAPGTGSTFTVRFDPVAAGSRSATISIDNDDTDESPYDFSIIGVGGKPASGGVCSRVDCEEHDPRPESGGAFAAGIGAAGGSAARNHFADRVRETFADRANSRKD